jgi:hypothetical protein
MRTDARKKQQKNDMRTGALEKTTEKRYENRCAGKNNRKTI